MNTPHFPGCFRAILRVFAQMKRCRVLVPVGMKAGQYVEGEAPERQAFLPNILWQDGDRREAMRPFSPPSC